LLGCISGWLKGRRDWKGLLGISGWLQGRCDWKGLLQGGCSSIGIWGHVVLLAFLLRTLVI
jgi:hypothetical protein